ncbi:MAG TPA: hypothetical protein VEQ66_14695 [Propionibacteriaceae bacterium]|nr:hypothetical protein [Propionibacteriaceae bacterium]
MVDVDAARAFIHGHARLVERRRFQHTFDGATAELVLTALTAYRNPDGGFGALEPDLRTPASQPIPTRYALEILAILPLSHERQALARGASIWLGAVANPDGGLPLVLPSAVEQAAAAWLQPSPESSLLATAQLAAAAHRLELEHLWLSEAAAYCWARVPAATPSDAYAFKYVVDFLDATPERARADRAIHTLAGLVPADGRIQVSGGADGEVLNPLAIAPSPRHAGARLFDAATLARALDDLEAGQGSDGGWDFTWAKWNPVAAWEWRGAVTLEALQTLRAYGRL